MKNASAPVSAASSVIFDLIPMSRNERFRPMKLIGTPTAHAIHGLVSEGREERGPLAELDHEALVLYLRDELLRELRGRLVHERHRFPHRARAVDDDA